MELDTQNVRTCFISLGAGDMPAWACVVQIVWKLANKCMQIVHRATKQLVCSKLSEIQLYIYDLYHKITLSALLTVTTCAKETA